MTEELAAAQRQVEEILLGGERRYTRQQVREKAGVPLDRSVTLWRALGFATVGDDDVVFTESDVEALRMTQELMLAGIIEPEMTTATARMLGQHLSRLAEWQVHLMTDILAANPELVTDERQLGRFIERLVPDLERLQNYTWRRHLAAYAGRALASPGEQLQVQNEVVGFADMVGFTTLTRRANEAELVTMVDRFDAMTAEIVADNHGRIVKMLGDEVLYVADSPRQGAEIALRLLEAAEADPDLPVLRAGMAYGRVLNRFGDVYGSVVNIAARLTGVARPGTVMIDRALADELSGAEAYTVRSRRPVSVRGFSRLKCAVLRRSEESKVPSIDLVPDERPRRKRR